MSDENIIDFNSKRRERERSYGRMAKLMGMPRTDIWRARLIGSLPNGLFEALLAADNPPTTTSLAAIALALRRGEARGNAVSNAHLAIVNRWLSERDR